MSEGITPELAEKILAADDRNLVEKVKAGATLNASERKRLVTIREQQQKPATGEPERTAAPSLFSPEEMESTPGQLSLFGECELQEVKGLSTGEGLRKRDPNLYAMVTRLLGQDAPIREIKRLTGLHHRTIQAVREREGECIDTMRKSLGRRALRTAALAIERLEEKIMEGDVKAGELAMSAGILIDKGQILTGGVTARTETIQSERIEDKLTSLLAGLPTADAILIETATEPIYTPENPAQCAPPTARPPEPTNLVTVDVESNVFLSTSDLTATLTATLTEVSPESTPAGEGGVEKSEGGVSVCFRFGLWGILCKGA